jgi:hypothetical protein
MLAHERGRRAARRGRRDAGHRPDGRHGAAPGAAVHHECPGLPRPSAPGRLHEAPAGWAPPPDAVWGGIPSTVGRIAEEVTELVSHRDYCPGNVVFRDGLPAAFIDFDLAKPTTRLYDVANALWYWAPLRDPRDRAPAFADLDVPHRVAVFADAYGLTAEHRAAFAIELAGRYFESARAAAEMDRYSGACGKTAPRTNCPALSSDSGGRSQPRRSRSGPSTSSCITTTGAPWAALTWFLSSTRAGSSLIFSHATIPTADRGST